MDAGVEGRMKTIPLSRGFSAIVDDCDFEMVLAIGSWYATSARPTYAAHRKWGRDGHRLTIMHRLILGAKPGEYVDHINNNGLDNRRANLRIATHAQNVANSRKRRTRANSRYKGVRVHFRKDCVVFGAVFRGKHLAIYRSEAEAARRYDEAALEYFGEFAKVNFPGHFQESKHHV
jgi:hypothetical protein